MQVMPEQLSRRASNWVLMQHWPLDHKEGELLVRFHPNVTMADRQVMHARMGMQVIEKFSLVPVEVVRVADHQTLREKLARYRANYARDVRGAELHVRRCGNAHRPNV